MHHGEFGAITTVAGVGAKSPFVTGLGVGLIVSDLDDIDEWFTAKPHK
jgi:hypothetical protein